MSSQCIAESNRYRGRDSITQLLKIGEDLPWRNPEEPGQRVQNQGAGLVENEEIDIIHRQLVAIEQCLHLWWYLRGCECQNAEAVHMNVLLAAPVAVIILVLQCRICRYGHAVTASGDNKLVIPSAIGGAHHVHDVPGSRVVTEPRDSSSVPEEHTGGSVTGVNLLGVCLRRYQQDVVTHARGHESSGKSQPINEARTRKVDVRDKTVLSQSQ